MIQTRTNIIFPTLLLLLIAAIGTYGYFFIEQWPLLDCFYMTIITLSTVGYGEIHKLSHTGKIFTSFLIITGVGSMGYALGSITQFLIEGQIYKILGQKKMEKEIQKLAGHYIVCGYGGVGRQVCQELMSRKIKILVVESNADTIIQAQKDGFLALQRDATNEDFLIEAGIKKAKALITSIGSDASNVFITLSARVLNPALFVVVRAETVSSEKKLLRAGANRVISTDLIGGRKMALAAMRPNIVEFMEIVTLDAQTGYRIEEMMVKEGCSIAGQTLSEANIRHNVGVMIIGIKQSGKNLMLNPPPDTKIRESDILIAVGNSKQLKKLFKLTHPGGR